MFYPEKLPARDHFAFYGQHFFQKDHLWSRLRVIQQKDAPRAEQLLRAYLDAAPDNSELPPRASAREWLGRLYEAQGKRAEAAEQYRAALQLDPKRKEAKARLEKLEKSSG